MGWELQKFGDICHFTRGPFGGSLKKSCFVPEGFAVYEQQHAINDQFDQIRYFVDPKKFEDMRRFEVSPGDLIMSCSGTMGKVAIVPEIVRPGIINQALLKLTPMDSINTNFLYQFMQSPAFQDQLGMRTKGAAIKNVAAVKVLKEILIHLPPLPEQRRIVAILDKAFAGIDAAMANTRRNLANARELFESHLNAVFSRKGDGWVETTIGKICSFENGDRGKNYPNKSEYVSDGIPWINTGHINPDGSLDSESMNYITREKFMSLRGGKIRSGDLVYCLRGATIGKTAFVEPYTEGAIASSLMIIRPGSSISRLYLYYYLTSELGRQQIRRFENGAAQPNLGGKSVAKFEIFLPPVNIQNTIVNKLQELAEETQRLEALYQRKLDALTELKQSLLQKAFSGQLTVQEAAA
ncbi:MAG: restriction endonuclease subunit S [Magnetococcales bacterium]|nr:restriction endonuclease subunit S [Magnetococcales bacterium]